MMMMKNVPHHIRFDGTDRKATLLFMFAVHWL